MPLSFPGSAAGAAALKYIDCKCDDAGGDYSTTDHGGRAQARSLQSPPRHSSNSSINSNLWMRSTSIQLPGRKEQIQSVTAMMSRWLDQRPPYHHLVGSWNAFKKKKASRNSTVLFPQITNRQKSPPRIGPNDFGRSRSYPPLGIWSNLSRGIAPSEPPWMGSHRPRAKDSHVPPDSSPWPSQSGRAGSWRKIPQDLLLVPILMRDKYV